jgi:hypothetical protein
MTVLGCTGLKPWPGSAMGKIKKKDKASDRNTNISEINHHFDGQ